MVVLGPPVEGLYVYDYSGDALSRPREFAVYVRSDTEFEEQMIIREQPFSYSRFLSLTTDGLSEVGSAVGSNRGYEERRWDSPLLLLPAPVVVSAAWEQTASSQGGWTSTHSHRSLTVTDVAPTAWQGRPDYLVTVREVMTDGPQAQPALSASPGAARVGFAVSGSSRRPMESIRIYLASRCLVMSETIVMSNAQVSTREIVSFPSG